MLNRRGPAFGGIGALSAPEAGAGGASAVARPAVADPSTSEHYTWGGVCDGWRLLARPDLSVIRERAPAGAGEVRHRHHKARQFFFVLTGAATVEFEHDHVDVGPGQGVEVAPGVRHRFVNRSDQDVEFLVISAPTTAGDRVED